MKAQSFFGGTHPKETGKCVRQVGHKGKVQSRTRSLPMHENVRQAKSSPAPTTYKRKETVRQVGSKGRAK